MAMDNLGSIYDYWKLGNEPTITVPVGTTVPLGTTLRSDIGNNPLEVYDGVAVSTGPYALYNTEDTVMYNNMSVVSSTPASSFQYSWINDAISGAIGKGFGAVGVGWMSGQRIRGYAPKSGEVKILGNGQLWRLAPAINFPSSSALYGD